MKTVSALKALNKQKYECVEAQKKTTAMRLEKLMNVIFMLLNVLT